MAKTRIESASTSEVKFKSNRDIAIHVPDLQKAEEFYGATLGFKVFDRSDSHLGFETGTFRLWVNKDRMPQSFVPSFSVSGSAAAAGHLLESRGCTRVPQSSTYFKDPFGFVFDIIEDKS